MKLILALAVSLLIPALVFNQAKNSISSLASNDEQDLRNLVIKWNEAESKGDYEYIAKLLADDFSFLDGLNKKQYLNLAGGNDGILAIDFSIIEKIEVKIYGDAAIVTTLNSFKEKAARSRFPTDKFRFMTIWIKTDGKWKCVKAAINAVEKNNQSASDNSFNRSAS